MSKLTQRQWANLERLVMRDGMSMRAAAERYGISEATVRERLKKVMTERIEDAAVKLADGERAIRALKPVERVRARSLAEMLTEMSHTMSEVAEMDMRNALRLTQMKADRLAKIEPGNVKHLREVVLLSEAANKSSKLGVDLMTIGKQSLVDSEKERTKDREVMTLAPINIPALRQS